MLHQANRPSLQSSHKVLCILTLHLLLTHSCRGQSQLIGSSQPIVTTVGDDIILPCQLQPAEDVSVWLVEWTRPDLGPIIVHAHRAGQELTHVKHPSYQERTSLSIDGLKQGNISLKLSKVKRSDGGKYRCHVPQVNKESFVELIVATDAISSPVISVAGIDRDRGGVVLQCESKGWYPQPQVFWLDGEGNLLSAEPTKTVRGPDGLYTVSRRVTVEKRHSNNFTCRVQQNKINQTRETHIIVADDLFKAQPSSSPVIIGLAVSLVVCIVLIVAVFCVWKWRQNMNKTKETEGGGNKKLSKSDDTEMQPLNPAGPNGQKLPLEEKQAATERLLQEEKQKREEAEKEVEDLKNQLESNQKQIKTFRKSVKQLKAQNKELRETQDDIERLLQEEQNREKAEREVEDLKNQLDSNQKQIETLQKSEKHLKAQNEELKEKPEEDDQRKTDAEDVKNLEELENKEEDKSPPGGNSIPAPNSTPDENDGSNTSCQTQGASKHNDTNPASKNATEAPVFVEITRHDEHLRLTNKSKEDLQLEGWTLRVKVNDENPIMYTFEKSITLKAEKSVTIWASGWGTHHPPSELIWIDLQHWDKEDELLVELINCHEEIVKTTEYVCCLPQTQGPSQHYYTNPASKNATESLVFVKVDPRGTFIGLTNKFEEDLKLEGWRLQVKVNDQNPITYTFDKTVILRAEKKVTIWAQGFGCDHPPSDLIWTDLKRWTKGDKLLVELINCHEEIVKTTEGDKSPHGKNSHSDPISPQKKMITAPHPLWSGF